MIDAVDGTGDRAERGVVAARLRRRAPHLLLAGAWSLGVSAVVVLWWHPTVGVALAVALPLHVVGTAAVLLRTPPDPAGPVVELPVDPGGPPPGVLVVSCTGTTPATGRELVVSVDARPLALVTAGASARVAVPAGPHRVRVSGGGVRSPEISLTLTSGGEQALVCGPVTDGRLARLLRPGRSLSLRPLMQAPAPAHRRAPRPAP